MRWVSLKFSLRFVYTLSSHLPLQSRFFLRATIQVQTIPRNYSSLGGHGGANMVQLLQKITGLKEARHASPAFPPVSNKFSSFAVPAFVDKATGAQQELCGQISKDSFQYEWIYKCFSLLRRPVYIGAAAIFTRNILL